MGRNKYKKRNQPYLSIEYIKETVYYIEYTKERKNQEILILEFLISIYYILINYILKLIYFDIQQYLICMLLMDLI